VQWDGKYVLVDASTDLRRQMLREQVPHIDALLLTHSHADHIHGIDDLRGFHFIHRRVIPCYGSARTIGHVSKTFGYIFDNSNTQGYSPLCTPVVIDGPFSLFGRTVVPVPLLHGQHEAIGYRFGNAAYLTDCSTIPESSLPLLEGLELLIIDALRYSPHPNHFNIEGALHIAHQLTPRRTVFTHLTHEVAHQDGERLPQGVELAYDGMEFEL